MEYVITLKALFTRLRARELAATAAMTKQKARRRNVLYQRNRARERGHLGARVRSSLLTPTSGRRDQG